MKRALQFTLSVVLGSGSLALLVVACLLFIAAHSLWTDGYHTDWLQHHEGSLETWRDTLSYLKGLFWFSLPALGVFSLGAVGGVVSYRLGASALSPSGH